MNIHTTPAVRPSTSARPHQLHRSDEKNANQQTSKQAKNAIRTSFRPATPHPQAPSSAPAAS
jgi:hypothetical protein